MLTSALIAAVVGAAVGAWVAFARAGRDASEAVEIASAKAKSLVQRAAREAQAEKTKRLTEVREQALADRSQAEAALAKREQKVAKREQTLNRQAGELDELVSQVVGRDEELNQRHEHIKSRRDQHKSLRRDAEERAAEMRSQLEDRAGVEGRELAERLGSQWIEKAQADAAHRVRAIDQSAADSSWSREAERLLTISSGRYQNHFLTERLISNVKVADGVADLLTSEDGRMLRALEEVSNVKLNVSDTGEAIRLEGLDGVGREIARRALAKLSKKPQAAEAAKPDPTQWATKIKDQLEREILGLGRKAFQVLEIKRADPEIVDLVGRLNWRTSYTQNQWLHAVEASFLCGMIAEEMGLDVKLARRATLMHDIGKALTHQIEGSHAVIGADIARRVGEDELVANAIGAHHLDEPMNSAYAFLVAAADAMSGARPGARREHEGGFNTKLQDLERIGRAHRVVENAYAVHGGRELRVYVDESRVSDLDAVELSSEIAEQISDEMVFPGQIKVTVIRATEAVSTAN